MDVLVTGGAGFIGSNLCEYLLGIGHKVICIDNFDDYYSPEIKKRNIERCMSNDNFTLCQFDIENKEELKKVFEKADIVVHLAARAGVRASYDNPKAYFNSNVLGTLNILELCREFKTKLIFGSSSSVYGNDNIPFSEKDPAEEQLSFYGTSKRIAERLCEMYSKIYGLNIIILRFFSVYGPRIRPDLAAHIFVKNILEGKKIKMFGNGDSKRDYTYISDIINGIISAMDKDFSFEVINLGDSNPVMLRDFISLIQKVIGKKAIIEKMPEQKGEMKVTYADISKAKKLLDWEPEVDIEEGIKLLVGWYKEK